MKEKFKKLFYRLAYLDLTGACKKEDTYFHRFSREIGQSNLRTMRSMSIFMLIISIFIIASTFTHFGAVNLRWIYMLIAILEVVLLGLIQLLLQKKISDKVCTVLTTTHLLHMLIISGYIGVFYCKDETALLFAVVLTISSMIFTLPTVLTMSVSSLCTALVIIASYYVKDVYWFESDTLNGISVLLFSFMFGWQVNRIRAEEAFARADAQRLNGELKKISITDPLTGLYNHRRFQENYYEIFRRASTGGLALGVIMMDLDKFKSFNDRYGHVAGDECLRRVASAIAASVPKVVTLSLGAYVGVPVKNEQPMNFVDRADKAMYQSKEAGRNRLTVTFG